MGRTSKLAAWRGYGGTLAAVIGSTGAASAAAAILLSLCYTLFLRDPPGVGAGARVGRAWVIPSDASDGPIRLSPVMSLSEINEARRQLSPAVAIAGYAPREVMVEGHGTLLSAQAAFVTAEYFDVLQPPLREGRVPTRTEASAERPLVVISQALAERLGWSAAGGRTLIVNGLGLRVIGVARAPFHGADNDARVDLWVPAALGASTGLGPVQSGSFKAFAIIFRGIGAQEPGEQVRAVLTRISASMSSAAGPGEVRLGTLRDPLGAARHQAIPPPAIGLLALSFVVLAVGVGNALSLLMVLALARQPVVVTLRALGASVWRLVVDQLEVALPVIGGALASGAGLTAAGLFWLSRRGVLDTVPPAATVASVLGLVLLGTVMVIVAVPVAYAHQTDLMALLRQGALGGGSPGVRRLLRAVVGLQTAAALVTGGVVVFVNQAARSAADIPLGFDVRDRYAVQPRNLGAWGAVDGRDVRRLQEILQRSAGVRAVTVATTIPLRRVAQETRTFTSTQGRRKSLTLVRVNADPAFFHVLSLPILAGRPLTVNDAAADPQPVVVGAAFAARRGGPHATLNTCLLDAPSEPCERVVGITGDARLLGVHQPAPDVVFAPLAEDAPLTPALVVAVGAGAGVNPIIRALERAGYQASGWEWLSLAELAAESTRTWRLAADVAAAAALTAILLTVVGLSGMLRFEVAQQRRRVGVLMALGASRSDLARELAGPGLLAASAGVVTGALTVIAVLRRAAPEFGAFAGGLAVPMLSATGTVVAVLVLVVVKEGRAIPRTEPAEWLREK